MAFFRVAIGQKKISLLAAGFFATLFVSINLSIFLSLRAQFPQWSYDTLVLAYYFVDLQYLGLAVNLANFSLSDFQTFAGAGGLLSFPIASSVPQALGFLLGGKSGLVAVKILSTAGVFCAVTFFFRQLIASTSLAALFAFFFVFPLFYHIGFNGAGAGAGAGAESLFWIAESYQTRLPRPLVTQIYGFLALGFLAAIFIHAKHGAKNYFCLALCLSLLLQGDIYHFFHLAVLSAVILAAGGFCLCRRTVLASLLGASALLPFLLQLAYGETDMQFRLGVETGVRGFYAELLLENIRRYGLGLAALAVLCAVHIIKGRKNKLAAPHLFLLRAVLFFLALYLIAHLDMGLFGTLSPKAIQMYHFLGGLDDSAPFLLPLAAAACLLSYMRQTRAIRLSHWGHCAALGGAVLAAGVFVLADFVPRATQKHLRSDFALYDELGADYQNHFSQVSDYLTMLAKAQVKTHPSRPLEVLTYDHQIAAWWTAFAGGKVFLPDVFASAWPQNDIVKNYARACQIIGLTAPQCLASLTLQNPARPYLGMNNANLNFFFSHAGHHKNAIYPHGADAPKGVDAFASWHLWLDDAAQSAIMGVFTGVYAQPPRHFPDVIVLPKISRMAHLDTHFSQSPTRKKYDLMYETEIYKIYVHRGGK